MRGGHPVVVTAVVVSLLILPACSDSEEMLAPPTGAAACGTSDLPLRFQKCSPDNGTVTDWNPDSTLIWLKDADCFGRLTFADATSAAADLKDGDCGLTDGSTAGAWRLPTREEWTRIVKTDCSLGEPHIPNAADDACWSEDDPFTTVQPSGYWSSTEGSITQHTWTVFLNDAYFIPDLKTATHYVWPVRRP